MLWVRRSMGCRRRAVRGMWPLDGAVPHPMEREPIKEPLQTGLRVLDGMLTVGRGQRVGIFGGSGVGKSTLIGMMTRNTAADITVVGLVGERGREVREFVEDSLGEEGWKRSVVLVSTSDQSPLLRMRAAMAATAVAEFYAARGKHVLLVLDSLTRYAMAAREIGLAAGEPPASKGYTPSRVRAAGEAGGASGEFSSGKYYCVLYGVDGGGRSAGSGGGCGAVVAGWAYGAVATMAAGGWYPPVDVLDSLSRLMPAVTTPEHRTKAAMARRLLAAHARSEDLVRIGAYKAGTDAELDRAMRAMPLLREFLEQESDERVTMQESVSRIERDGAVDDAATT